MDKDIREFILAYSAFACSKNSHQAPSGLCPPPVPIHPWSHVAVDFITGLPESEGNTVILVVVEWFSKAANFIVWPELPLASETARAVFDHVFKLHGFP